MTLVRRIRGAAEMAVLAAALRTTAPACADDARFVAEPEDLAADDIVAMTATCRACPLLAKCSEFGRRGRPSGGFYAGRHYPPERKRAIAARHDTKEDR